MAVVGKHIINTMKHGGGSIMPWGCFFIIIPQLGKESRSDETRIKLFGLHAERYVSTACYPEHTMKALKQAGWQHHAEGTLRQAQRIWSELDGNVDEAKRRASPGRKLLTGCRKLRTPAEVQLPAATTQTFP